MSSSNNSGNREHKRKRLTQACELCRRKKIKCDGGKPACNNCIRLKNICTYSSTNKKRGPRQGYIEILEQRLAKMEQILLSDSISSGNTLSDVKGLDQTSYKDNQVEEQKRYNETLPQISSSTTHFTSAEGYNNDNDMMNNYSESSNNARKNQKKRSNEDLYSETSPSSYSSFSHNFPSSNIHMLNQCSPLLQEDKTNQNNLFPSMSVIEHLVDIFFKYLFSITPIFDERKLRDDIRDQKCSDFLILCLLAACARFSDRPDIKENPPWRSGEKYAEKAREILIKAIDEPSIPNLQAIILLSLHEYGCGRGPRCWMYSGIAIRMAMELGLHEELTENQHVENTSEKLVNQEIRRGLFWTVYSIDRISSAATGRPSVIQDNSCSVFLPGKVDQDKENQYYSETLDNNRHIFLNVNEFRKSYLLGAYNLGTVPLNDDIGTFQYLSHFAYFIRAIKLLGRVTNYVNQKGKGGQSDLPPYHPDSEFTKLDQDIDNWQNQLPMHLKNTLTNLELDKNIEPTNSNQQLFIIHILYNTIIVLLHRPSLVMMDTLNNDAIQPVIKEFVRKSVNKCMAAVDNVTNLLRLGRNRKELLPPYITYFIYTVATVVVSTLFSPRPEEAQKAKQALGVYFELLLTARNYWAMADKLYFMIRDLYALHINVLKRYQTNSKTPSNENQTTGLLVAQQEPQMQQSTLPVYSQQHMNALDMPLPGNINDSLSDWTLSYYNAAMSTETPEVGLMNDQDQNMLFSTNFFQIPKNYDQSLFFSTFTPVNSDINSNNL